MTQVSHTDYQQWLSSLKQVFRQRQLKAAVAVNTQLLEFYWHLGQEIVEKQQSSTWGQGFLTQLSKDLMAEFPDIKGFSKRNLEQIRRWYLFWSSDAAIAKQAATQFLQIPWWHNIVIVTKAQNHEEALFYVAQTQQHGWSRAVLTHQMESQLWQRTGSTVTNFEQALPSAQSDLAQQTLKDPYVFDFLTLTEDYNEHELEKELVSHISQFLLELGAGFAYVGKQVPVSVGDKDFYIDLLFYHVRLHCYVVIELKTGDFKPEYAGKLNFYINAVDGEIKTEQDQPTIGLLLCHSKDKLIAEYALKGIDTPMGISEYQLTQAIPAELQDKLPSIEQIERELAEELNKMEGDKS
ncbi:PDDEXK nuclease domain-containing protein [Oceanospirillum sediminis]|uniref:DUF1016 domain-containing protein n=1 Tax=Oceanospirillum sediminis TaxID=2760088 RepID=A0A839IW84_9GAMM|nr:PDDEXK nuclease domain-containing protein [Oceanospirillum sediminis]MBB1488637.1 DUF1016 domain-containing protein [Oceanospirillum sediminis]